MYKTKNENKNTTNEYRYFLEINFVGVNRLFVLVYTNEDAVSKKFKAKRYCLQKGIINSCNAIINGKNFYDQPIDSDIKRYEEIRKLTTGQEENCTTGCLLEYEYFKNHYRLIEIDLSRQKELDADPKAIQKLKFVGQLNKLYAAAAAAAGDNDDDDDDDDTESMFILTILEKIKETRLKSSQGSVTVL